VTGTPQESLEEIEVGLLLEAVFRYYGYDFRDYAPGSLRRRVRYYMGECGLHTISALQDRLLHDPDCLGRFLLALSVNVTSLFRDPAFFLALRNRVVPLLRSCPHVRVWVAGCSTGEEAYSLAVLLEEEGLYAQSRIYATDFNETVLGRADEGSYPLASMAENGANYLAAGGKGSLDDFYAARHNHAVFHARLRKNILFAQHNLVTDGSFNEFHLILMRNLLIYFNRTLQDRVHRLVYESLPPGGVLGLGIKELLRCSPHENEYEELDSVMKLYRKVR
jgi:chemotaxis protein methyltransferase CheR